MVGLWEDKVSGVKLFTLATIYFVLNDTATTEIYTHYLHDALPIELLSVVVQPLGNEAVLYFRFLPADIFGYSVLRPSDIEEKGPRFSRRHR